MGKHLHKLSEKNIEARTAVCAACGPVGLVANGHGTFSCSRSRKPVNPGMSGKKMPAESWHRISNIRAEVRLGDCSICGPDVKIGNRSTPTRTQWACLNKLRDRRGAHGLNYFERQEMVAEAGGRCEICGTTDPGKRGWMIDHCHDTGAVRGVLCSPCNVGIGMLGDDIDRLRAAVAYLNQFMPTSEDPNASVLR